MSRFHSISIIQKNAVGIMNPKLCLVYKSKNPNPDFKVYLDNKISDYSIMKLAREDEYLLEATYDKKVKFIKLVIVEDGEEKRVTGYYNLALFRFMYRINEILKSSLLKIKIFFLLVRDLIVILWKNHHFILSFKQLKKYLHDFKVKLKNHGGPSQFYNPFMQLDYLKWLNENEKKEKIQTFEYNPLISLLIPVYNVSGKLLSACLDSILSQTYQNFEICLADDCSTNQETLKTLKFYEKKDSRIKVVYRKENGHISKATNSALEIAKGEFIGLVDNDDVLAKNALYENVKALNENNDLDFIYSDEDKLDIYGQRIDPHFKPDYSPDTLLSLNYICHFAVIRKSIVDEIGGFTVGMEGAQDYDLFLRVVEKTNHIHHIPKILYHWRMIEGSTSMSLDSKGYAQDKGKMALEAALKRRNIEGTVEIDPLSRYYQIKYGYDEPLVSIIIPMKDYADVTERCLESLYEKTTYKNYEVILVNNNSSEKASFDLFEKYTNKYDNFKLFDANIEFNYSKINNKAIEQCNGEVLVLLNNDTEIITPDWLTIMVGYALQSHVGAVGAKLLYPDMTIQHAGVILGLGGVASHAYIGAGRDFFGAYGRVRCPYDYAAVTAACLAVTREKFAEVGQLEEDLKVAYNDVDFNIKLLKAGYYNVFLPQVELIHHESKSRGLDTTSEKYKRFVKEQEYMYKKWNKIIKNDGFYNANYSKHLWFVLDKK